MPEKNNIMRTVILYRPLGCFFMATFVHIELKAIASILYFCSVVVFAVGDEHLLNKCFETLVEDF